MNEYPIKDELDDVTDTVVDIDPVNRLFLSIDIGNILLGTFELFPSGSTYR